MTEKKTEEKEPSRRDFIKGTVAGAVAGAVLGAVTGAGAGAMMAPQGPQGPPGTVATSTVTQTGPMANAPAWDADVLVVGAGTAGLPAIIEAADKGANVLVLEKAPILGGTLNLSTGFVSAAITREQIREGIQDSTDLLYYDYLRISGGDLRDGIVRRYADYSGQTYDWLEALGVPFDHGLPVFGVFGLVKSFLPPNYPEHSARRCDHIKGPTPATAVLGAAISAANVLVSEVNKRVARGNVKLSLQTRATALIQDLNGRVIGVKATTQSGEKEFYAKTTILSCGGFSASNEKHAQWCPPLRKVVSESALTNTGDGVEMLLAIGADNFHLADPMAYDVAVEDPDNPGRPWQGSLLGFGEPGFPYPACIVVNKAGDRVFDESAILYKDRAVPIVNADGNTLFMIVDEKIIQDWKSNPIFGLATVDDFKNLANTVPFLKSASTVADLANAFGFSADGLTATVTKYNAYVAAKKDPDFGKANLKYKIENPPFYGIQLVALSLLTYGGILVNKDCQVLTKQGEAVKGLYIVGEIMGGASTTGYHLIQGGYLTTYLTLGRLVGQDAAREALLLPSEAVKI